MKLLEKTEAIKMRNQGISIGEIARTIGVSKSSVSLWVREIKLSKSQLKQLNINGHSVESIDKRRISRLSSTKKRHNQLFADAYLEASDLFVNPLWNVGISLYWGEGGKTKNLVRIANSDPAVITVMMNFFRSVCHVPEDKFRAHVHTFMHANVDQTIAYWSQITGIQKSQFFKTYQKNSAASLHKRETLPNGTVQIYVLDTSLFFRIMGWIEYIKYKHSI
jgi:transposase-like protein